MLLVNNNNNILYLYSADLYMDIFRCALQYCQIKIMFKVSKNIGNYLMMGIMRNLGPVTWLSRSVYVIEISQKKAEYM